MVIIIHSSRKKVRINLLKFLMSMLIICSVVFGTVSLLGDDNTVMSAPEHCEKVVVYPGDSLWSIASELNDGSFDTRDIVNDISELNRLSSPAVFVGQTLSIPSIYSVN